MPCPVERSDQFKENLAKIFTHFIPLFWSPDEPSIGEAAHRGDRGGGVEQVLPLHRLPHQQGGHARRSGLPSLHGAVLLQDKVSF